MSDPTDFSWTNLLYRLFDADDELLYIGRTNDVKERFKRHSQTQPWWNDVARSAFETYPDLETLCAAEKAAIIAERPRHNKVYNGRYYRSDSDGELAPWIGISARVTAAADVLHEHECRQERRANYPDLPDPIDDPPCIGCVMQALLVLAAADEALGHVGEDLDAVRAAIVHHESRRAIWEIRHREDVAVACEPLRARCQCDECAPHWADFDSGLWLVET